MSATVDQRKGQASQVTNGPTNKETVKDSDFEAYLQSQPHQAYNPGPMSSSNVSDQYNMPNYYPNVTFPYLGEGAWSSGGDPLFSLGNYGQVGSDYMSNNATVFGGYDYGQGGTFGWFPGSDYNNAWGNNSQNGGKNDTRGYEDYYHPDQMQGYGVMNGDADPNLQNIDQGLQNVNLNDNQGENQDHSPPVETSQTASPPATVTHVPKKMSWASVASQPAKPQPQVKPKSIPRAPVPPSKQNMDIGTWDTKNSAKQAAAAQQQPRQAWGGPRGRGAGITPYSTGPYLSNSTGNSNTNSQGNPGSSNVMTASPASSNPVLDKLRSSNQYNPREFNINPKNARFFIIKSYSEDDIHRSIKYSIWCSTEHGNKRLDAAFHEREGKGPVYLLYSVNGSGHFCGMAQMLSAVEYGSSAGVWAQDKWKGKFSVRWIYVKDVPNSQLRHIRLENNENKPVTNSRDTQEVPLEKGKQVLKILHSYRHTTSIFDDFGHYEKRQEEEAAPPAPSKKPTGRGGREREYRN